MHDMLSVFRQHRFLKVVFLSNIFLSLHSFVIHFVNSSFLAGFFSETELSALYIIGSIIDTIVLIHAPQILSKIGSGRFILYASAIELISTIGLIIANHPLQVALYFLCHIVVISSLLFNMDVVIEEVAPDDQSTGMVRGMYLTITNIIVVISPLITSLFYKSSTYSHIYTISAFFLVLFYITAHGLRKVTVTPHVSHGTLMETARAYINDRNLFHIFMSQLFLQLFYAYMGIYIPLYLQSIGFTWNELGIMFAIMLLPFVLFETPIGKALDAHHEERGYITVGFIIMGLSTIFISFITTQTFWVWATILFITRIGASFVEIGNESYFFKKVDKDKTDMIGFFRVTRPISFIISPLVALLLFLFIPFNYIFIFIGSLMIVATKYSLGLDTIHEQSSIEEIV